MEFKKWFPGSWFDQGFLYLVNRLHSSHQPYVRWSGTPCDARNLASQRGRPWTASSLAYSGPVVCTWVPPSTWLCLSRQGKKKSFGIDPYGFLGTKVNVHYVTCYNHAQYGFRNGQSRTFSIPSDLLILPRPIISWRYFFRLHGKPWPVGIIPKIAAWAFSFMMKHLWLWSRQHAFCCAG